MLDYIIKRSARGILVIFIIILFSFFIIHMMPGDPVMTMLGDKATPEQINSMRKELNLDKPLIEQFLTWIFGFIKLDMGNSLIWQEPVIDIIISRIEPTLILALMATMISVIIGVPVGIKASREHNMIFDKFFSVASLVSISLPAFWIAIIFIHILGVKINLFPVAGYRNIESAGLLISIYDLMLPSIVLGVMHSGQIARMTRTQMIDILQQDYLKTARAKGLSENKVIHIHAFINALSSIIMVVSFGFAALLGGAAVIEQIFNIPGTGNLVITAVNNRDYPLIQGVLLFIGTIFVFTNMFVDILCTLINPRTRFE
ncbi:dipeptide transporter; membrane component of ABC superfamily [Acetoanaerobium sticklandii]|uniref:Dipeptide transporter membrane component of ABC superfamily n=1 Tax=Acetoanaerobium sticklandii (strain ATCC 12662 / DSM 519 / JCM 1433 / CCUG 9281 / NCIMB 10654 / HF) TaxID=499177 RepID=E3PR78_ACESD|nr:ABC transporter permease [Acetoanaerobium sticklandii]CBH20213.1 dipeptide transporter; membrane component of ABC superfamily [Acetoanaerobium sticklandii]